VPYERPAVLQSVREVRHGAQLLLLRLLRVLDLRYTARLEPDCMGSPLRL
jgi:hypothetical protein